MGYQLKLSKREEERVESLGEKAQFVNLCEPANLMFTPEYLADLKKRRVAAVNITTAVPWGDIHHHIQRYYEFHKLIEDNSDKVGLVDRYSDIEKNRRAGKVSFVLGLQGLDFIGNELAPLTVFRKLGLLVTTLAYNRRNTIGDGISEAANSGLSVFGKQVLEELNRLGIVIDLAHVGEQTALEAIEHSKVPVINSHSNSAALVPAMRNIPDKQISAIAEKGGVVGLVAYAQFVRQDRQPTLKDLINHMKHVEEVASINNVGIGLDLFPWHKIPGEEEFMRSIRDRYPETRSTYKFSKNIGIRDATEWLNLVGVMVAEGYSDSEIGKVMGGNALRVFRKAWK